jgi:hypothetical protein
MYHSYNKKKKNLLKICPILNLQGCKSIGTGIVIILCAVYNYKNIVIFFGSSIIGLHIAQMVNEYNIINNK